METDLFEWVSPVVPSPHTATGDAETRMGMRLSPVSPVVPSYSERLLAEQVECHQEPESPCPACGGPAYYQVKRGGPWRCWHCSPPERGPVAVLTVPGGWVPDGEPQGVDKVLATACEGLGMTPAQFRARLSPADLADIAHGRMTPETVRAYAAVMSGEAVR